MYADHPVFEKPENPDTKIWRFIDFTKFLSLLDKEALFFSKADLLNDRFEGTIPKSPNQPKFKMPNMPGLEKFEKIIPREHHESAFRRLAYLCSFHMNEFESAALWKLYLKTNEGVAIQTTFNRLSKSFSADLKIPVYIGTVKYIDYNSDAIPIENAFYPLLHKRKSFDYERELRAVTLGIPVEDPSDTPDQNVKPSRREVTPIIWDDLPKGHYIPVNLDTLIENVYVAPTAPDWFRELAQSMMDRFSLERTVRQSSLDEDPLI